MAELGVREVTLIGGEAYLRDDWLEIVARHPRARHAVHDDDRRPRHDRRARAAPPPRRACRARASRSTASRRRTIACAAWPARTASALAAAGQPARRPACACRCNTQINRLSMPELPDVLETAIALGAHTWQIQLTVAMGRAADAPEVLLQPYDLLELFPLLARLKRALRRGRRRALAGQQHRLLRPVRVGPARRRCRAGTWRRAAPAAPRSASRPTARSRAARRCRRVPWTGGNVRDAIAAATSGSAPRRCATRAIAPSTICGATAGPATTPTSAAPAARGRRQRSSASRATTRSATTARSRCAAQGKRERLVQVDAGARRAVRPRTIRDHRRGDHAMSHLVPCPPATATCSSRRRLPVLRDHLCRPASTPRRHRPPSAGA